VTEPIVTLYTEDVLSIITLNRPERLNSFDGEMVVALDEALIEADADPTTDAIVVTGAGRAFSAGGDIRSFGQNPDRRVNRRGWHLVHSMLRVEKPSVAMVNGAAVGLGLTVALLCDLTIAADDAKLGDTHVNLGLVAGDGAALTLPLLLGPQRAKELLLTGRLVTGAEAAEMGMVLRSVPGDALCDEAYALARELAGQPSYAVRATKMVVNRYVRWMSHQVLDVALAYEEISKSKPEHAEAVAQWKAMRGLN